MEVLSVDTETGGLDPERHSLLSIGMVRGNLCSGSVDATFHEMVCPASFQVDAEALGVNRIDLRDVVARGRSPVEVGILARGWIKEQFRGELPLILGHNYPFDRGFITRRLLPEWDSEVVRRRFIDTSVLGAWLGIEDGSLAGLCKAFGVVNTDPHSALSDAISTFLVAHRMWRHEGR